MANQETADIAEKESQESEGIEMTPTVSFEASRYSDEYGRDFLDECLVNDREVLVWHYENEKYIEGAVRVVNMILQGDFESVVLLDRSGRPMYWLIDEFWDVYLPDTEKPSWAFLNVGRHASGRYTEEAIRGWSDAQEVREGAQILVLDEFTESGDSLLTAKGVVENALPNSEIQIASIIQFEPGYRDFDSTLLTGLFEIEMDTVDLDWYTSPEGDRYNNTGETSLVLLALGFTDGLTTIDAEAVLERLESNSEDAQHQLFDVGYEYPKNAIKRVREKAEESLKYRGLMKNAMAALVNSSKGFVDVNVSKKRGLKDVKMVSDEVVNNAQRKLIRM